MMGPKFYNDGAKILEDFAGLPLLCRPGLDYFPLGPRQAPLLTSNAVSSELDIEAFLLLMIDA
jgi:hypothetical protein